MTNTTIRHAIEIKTVPLNLTNLGVCLGFSALLGLSQVAVSVSYGVTVPAITLMITGGCIVATVLCLVISRKQRSRYLISDTTFVELDTDGSVIYRVPFDKIEDLELHFWGRNSEHARTDLVLSVASGVNPLRFQVEGLEVAPQQVFEMVSQRIQTLNENVGSLYDVAVDRIPARIAVDRGLPAVALQNQRDFHGEFVDIEEAPRYDHPRLRWLDEISRRQMLSAMLLGDTKKLESLVAYEESVEPNRSHSYHLGRAIERIWDDLRV